jgi:hemerythrin
MDVSTVTARKTRRDGNSMLWKDKYELGVSQIDAQHKELFRRVESFMQTLRSAGNWEEKVPKLNETLEFMKTYVVEHFRDEEEYQKSICYPGYEAHKQIHTGMVNYVLEVSKQYEDSNFNEQLMQQFGGKLLAWLINHVAAEDQRIADYAIKKGVGGNGR